MLVGSRQTCVPGQLHLQFTRHQHFLSRQRDDGSSADFVGEGRGTTSGVKAARVDSTAFVINICAMKKKNECENKQRLKWCKKNAWITKQKQVLLLSNITITITFFFSIYVFRNIYLSFIHFSTPQLQRRETAFEEMGTSLKRQSKLYLR